MNEVRVFITHSSVDLPLAEALVNCLRLGTAIGPDQVFCSSIDGIDVPGGEDFIDYIREQLEATTLVIPLITPAYMDSLFCMWELGAIWAQGTRMTPIRVDSIAPADLPQLLRTRQVKPLGPPALNAAAQAVVAQMGSVLNPDIWERHRDQMLSQAPGLIADLKGEWATTPAAKHRRDARAGAAIPQLSEALGRIRDAGFVMVAPTEMPDRAFTLLLKEVARAIAQLFKETTEVPVRVTMKQVIKLSNGEEGVKALGVVDLVRDRGPYPAASTDRVLDNTDFESIVVFKSDYFFCNDLHELIAQGTYRNSHVDPGSLPSYRSTIVWPIRKIYEPDDWHGPEIVTGQDLVGFLCVDSTEANIFSPLDAEIGAGLAAALYPVLRPYLYEDAEDAE